MREVRIRKACKRVAGKWGEGMNDTISRQAAIDALDCINGVEEILKSLPSTGPERKTGKWMEDKYGAEYCSECGKHPYNDGEYYVSGWWTEFCPHCGVRMEE